MSSSSSWFSVSAFSAIVSNGAIQSIDVELEDGCTDKVLEMQSDISDSLRVEACTVEASEISDLLRVGACTVEAPSGSILVTVLRGVELDGADDDVIVDCCRVLLLCLSSSLSCLSCCDEVLSSK